RRHTRFSRDWSSDVCSSDLSRSCQFASRRGYALESLRARQVCAEDFQRFDLILAMDHDNLARLQQLRPASARAELDLFLKRYDLGCDAVPDPYYGGDDGFEHVLDLVERASAALLAEIKGRLWVCSSKRIARSS